MFENKMSVFLTWVTLSTLVLLLFSVESGWSQKRERVTLKYTWVFNSNIAPVFMGLEKGFFAAEGIDLDWQDGRGSNKNLKLLSAKKLLMSFAGAGTAAKFISQGSPLKVVWAYLQTSPMAIIAHEDLGIRSPKDLEGKRLGAPPYSGTMAIFPAFANRNGVDVSKITLVNVTPAALQPSLLSRKVDAVFGYYPRDVPFLRSKGAKVNYLRYADHGVNPLDLSIVVHNSVFNDKPETLRRLLRGLSKSVAYTQTHPDEAVAALQKLVPLSVKNPEVALQGVKNVLSLVRTKNTRGKPLGWMAKKDWEHTVDILSKFGGLKNPLPVEKYYTNEFVPPAM